MSKVAYYAHDNHNFEAGDHDVIDGATLYQNQHTFYVPDKGYTQNKKRLQELGYEIITDSNKFAALNVGE